MTQTSRLIHGNLRLWSDDIALASIVASAGWNIDHLYRRGDGIGVQGRRATRHYAATETLIWSADEELSAWLMAMADHIIKQKYLVSQLAAGKIEGTVWLALFGDDEQNFPLLNEQAVARLTSNSVEILVENYTDFDHEGNPRKTWVKRNACATR